jgi:hypothetical protein
MEDLLRVSKVILRRLDNEAEDLGGNAVFLCAAMRRPLREAIEKDEALAECSVCGGGCGGEDAHGPEEVDRSEDRRRDVLGLD